MCVLWFARRCHLTPHSFEIWYHAENKAQKTAWKQTVICDWSANLRRWVDIARCSSSDSPLVDEDFLNKIFALLPSLKYSGWSCLVPSEMNYYTMMRSIFCPDSIASNFEVLRRLQIPLPLCFIIKYDFSYSIRNTLRCAVLQPPAGHRQKRDGRGKCHINPAV